MATALASTVAAAVVLLAVTAILLGMLSTMTKHSTPASQPAPITTMPLRFDDMRDFVTAYYHDLPAHPQEAWARLDNHCQQQTGRSQFLEFWSTISSVTLISISPRDATSVVARLTYVRGNGTSDSEDRWLTMVSTNGVTQLDESGRIGSVPMPGSSTIPTNNSLASDPIPASVIDTFLPTPTEVSRVVGATQLRVKNSANDVLDNSGSVQPTACVGLVFGAERAVYANTGFVAIRDQTFQPANYPSNAPDNTTGPDLVEQTVVVFHTPEQAQSVLMTSRAQWLTCASNQVTYRVPNTDGEVAWAFSFGGVQLLDNVLTVSMMSEFSHVNGSIACQQVLAARANVLVGVRTCLSPDKPYVDTPTDPNLAGDAARRLAEDIRARLEF